MEPAAKSYKMLDERNATKYINRKHFPFWLGGILCGSAAVAIAVLFVAGNFDLMISVIGIELLLYMLLNCVSGLIVTIIKPYIKKTLIMYVINFAVLFGLAWLLLGSRISDYRDYTPILEAFIFSFIGSFILVMLIRNVISYLKE